MINTEKINREMGAKRLTNRRLAEIAGVSEPTVSHLRTGKWNGDLKTLKSMVNAMGLRVLDVIDPKLDVLDEEVVTS
jgi:transcriptional regulator with XRE-family HTH domain